MEAVGQLTGGIAHDFNNLLTIVLGGLEVIGRQLPALGTSPAVARIMRARDMALQGVHRAVTLTNRLLAFSRQQPLTPSPIEANKLVAGVCELLRRTLGETVSLETVLAGGLWRAYADANQLENALLNLALNARDAMPTGGKVTIETANCHLDEAYVAGLNEPVEVGQYVMIAVADTGSGMDRETQARAFEPFFTTKEVGKGTGLGLSQVYGFVRQSSGHVTVYSEIGEGTTVKIYLPRYLGKEVRAEKPGSSPDTAMAIGVESILVVEDDAALRAYTIELLRELGYRVLEAPNAAAALAVLEREDDIDLLFTDVVMPGGVNGRQLADEAVSRRPGLKVLFTTGYTRNAIVHHGRLDAGVQMISKPFSFDELAAKIRSLLDGVS
jgi:CheY-like chemotaxis protein